MASPKKTSVLDPDYGLTEVAREHIKIKENAENRETLERIVDIINQEFKTELDHRQSQLDLIQQRLSKAQKTLHLLRYVLINTYYNDQHLFVQNDDESNSEDQLISSKNRLHPAVNNAMLGLNSNDYKLSVNKSPRKKMKYVDNVDINIFSDNLSSDKTAETTDKTVIQGIKTEDIKPLNNAIISPQKEEYDMIRNRKKTKYRIVVGNISKWMPSESEEDKSTHKWMVYVRGSKENPDISHFVKKVVFYLHPSYQPNDVVELRHPPFHLSRRGWGEFPLRVKIFFQYSLNKPVDIIHNLKLDKTFTGQQTLGNETIVNLFLYKNEKVSKSSATDLHVPTIKQEVQDDVEDAIHTNTNNLENIKNESVGYVEHDYCSVGLSEEVKNESDFQSYDFYKEHSYARRKISEPLSAEEKCSNNLMYGINDAELKKVVEENVSDQKNILSSNATVIAIKKVRKPQESLLKKGVNKNASQVYDFANNRLIVLHSLQGLNDPKLSLSSTSFVPIDYKKYQVNLPKNRFRTARQALPFLFKRVPLISDLASNLDYKCTFPYVAKSLEEYSTWNIGRRLSVEWYRAKMILKMIQDANLKNCENYTAKLLIMYARSHGYTPLANYEIFKNSTYMDRLHDDQEVDEDTTPALPRLINSEEEVVDIINCAADENKRNTSQHRIKLVDQRVERACSFVRQVVLDAGVILKPQEIIPGVIFNGAERMFLQAFLCLAEDLIRTARMNLVNKGNFQDETSVIDVEDIRKALSQRSEFKFLLKFGINSE